MNKTYAGNVVINDRNNVNITGVVSLDEFDDQKIVMTVKDALLTVEGENMSITNLDLDKGVVSASGFILAVYYSDGVRFAKKGIFSGLFGKKEK